MMKAYLSDSADSRTTYKIASSRAAETEQTRDFQTESWEEKE